MNLPKQVKLVEVGARDGLQNEKQNVPTEIKVDLINRLAKTGLTHIEATSFVSPRWVPQMADHSEVMAKIIRVPGVCYSALVPNEKGLHAALAAKVNEIAVFTAASETFIQKNINSTIAESLANFAPLITIAKQHQIRARGYISCSLGCPYEGEISPQQVAKIANELYQLGCDEISLGDTIGVGTPLKAQHLVETVSKTVPLDKLALHFHDTYGQAIANIFAVLQMGISIIDASVAGLGGCPYAPGAAGNVATEDVVYLLNGLGIHSGVDLKKIVSVGKYISDYFKRPPRSKVTIAMVKTVEGIM